MNIVKTKSSFWQDLFHSAIGCTWFFFQALICYIAWLAFKEGNVPAMKSLRFFFSPIVLIYYPIWYLNSSTKFHRCGVVEKTTRTVNLLLAAIMVICFVWSGHFGAAACWSVAGLSVLVNE